MAAAGARPAVSARRSAVGRERPRSGGCRRWEGIAAPARGWMSRMTYLRTTRSWAPGARSAGAA